MFKRSAPRSPGPTPSPTRTNGSTDPGNAPPAASPPDAEARFERDETEFLVCSDTDDFTEEAADRHQLALRFPTLAYESIYRDLLGKFEARFGYSSPEMSAFVHHILVCAGCSWAFPGSYTSRLIGMTGHVFGGTPGFKKFGRTGRCPRCASKESVLVYELYPTSEIDEEDVAAMRRLYRHDALRWWKATDRISGLCDRCSARGLRRHEGFLIGGSYLCCEACADKHLDNALAKLQRSPYYFGGDELRRARSFREH